MNVNFDNIKEKSILLTKYVTIPISSFLLCGALYTDYTVDNENDINKYENKLIDNSNKSNLIKQIENSNKDVIAITLDSNNGSSHPKDVKSIIDTNIKVNNLTNNVELIYIPNVSTLNVVDNYEKIIKENNLKLDLNLSSKDQYLKVKEIVNNQSNNNELIKDISNSNIKNKDIVINMSFGSDFKIDDKYQLNLDSLKSDNIQKHIKDTQKETNELISILNDNPNIKVVKAAGNSAYYSNESFDLNYTLHHELFKYMAKISNGNYAKMKDISISMNQIVKDSIDGKKIDKSFIDDLVKNNPNVNINQFMSLYIKDYLINYDTLAFLESSQNIQNNNFFVAEAYDYETFKNNYSLYKKYNGNNTELDYFFDKISYLKMNDLNGLSIKESKEIQQEFETYKDKYPEIFKISKFGTFSNFEYHDKDILKLLPDGENTGMITKFTGTSAAAPMLTSNIIENIVLEKENSLNRLSLN